MSAALGHLTLSLLDAAATRRLGAELAAHCQPGLVVLLRGPLGAGKTTLVDGFASALGANRAASPTFVIAHAYAGGRMPVSHLDLFRLDDPREIEDLDLPAYLPSDGVALVEWPERWTQAWPEDRIEVDLAIAGEARIATVRGFGALADIHGAFEKRAAP